VLADPSKDGLAFWLYIAGLVVSYAAIVLAALAVRAKGVHRYARSAQGEREPVTGTVTVAATSEQPRHAVSTGNGRSPA
jgi:hypothetical protein